MTATFVRDGMVIPVSATAGCTKGNIWTGTNTAGVYMATYSAASTNTAVPVALEGVFTVTKKAHATAWTAGRKIYANTTGGAVVAVGAATGTNVPLGIAVEAAATGATTGKVRLCTF